MTNANKRGKRRDALVTASLATALGIASSAALADASLYVNDFETRTSAEPTPALGVWQTAQPYPAQKGNLRYWVKGADAPYTKTAPLSAYFDGEANPAYGRPNVDGWFSPNIGQYTLAPYYWTSFEGSLADNPVLTWSYNSTTATGGAAIHPLHNEFTNGLLRMQVDLKAPVRWFSKSGRFCVFPVYRKYMDILEWNGTGHEAIDDLTPGKIGIRGTTGNSTADLVRSFPFWSNTSSASGTQLGNNDSDSKGPTNYWFRCIVTYDLDNNTFGGEIFRFRQDKGHPSFDTTPSDASAYRSFSGASARAALSAATGGISGFAVGINAAVCQNTAAYAANKPFVDNIRLSWKAPGASEFEVFYENDFTTRRYKTICAPSVARTGSYAQSTASVNETDTYSYPSFSGNLDKRMLVPKDVASAGELQPVGLDGWRRLPYRNYSGGAGNVAVHAYGGTSFDASGVGTNMVTYGDQGNISTTGQTLGKSFTSGRVKITVDARLPGGENLATENQHRRMAIGLGSTALYDSAATSADACGQLVAAIGYERLATSGICSSRPYTLAAYTSGDMPNRSYPASYSEPETNSWYRMTVEADLDTRTYSVEVVPLGSASLTLSGSDSVTASPIFSATGLAFAANVSDIGSFYLYGYGYGAATTASYINSRVCFDNVRVYHNADLVYKNDFTTRTRNVAGATRETGNIAALQYNLDGGQDHWVRRDYTGSAGFDARTTVRNDNGNQYLALGRSAEAGRTILVGNSLGVSLKKLFRFEADIRPPSQWSEASGEATIALGDSQMAQTEAPESFYAAHRLISFGFTGTNTANSSHCPYYFSGCKAQVCGTQLNAEIDTTHWYRFRLNVNPTSGLCDVQLFDMGTAHPALASRRGEIVAEATNVAFENALSADEGISTIHISGKGLSGSVGSLGVDPAHVLIDNIKALDKLGLTVWIR